MKILHVISAPAAGGAEVYVSDLARQMARAGNRVHIGFLSHAVQIGRSAEYEQQFIAALDKAGVSYFFIGHNARRMPWAGIKKVRKYVADNDIDIYHAHLTYGVIFGTSLSVPRVYTHHNMKMRMNRFLFRSLCRFIDHLVGISRACGRRLAEFSGREVTTILNSVDSRRMSQIAPGQRSIASRIDCIAVGQICAQKDYSLMLRAVAELPDELRCRVHLTIVGDGKQRDVDAVRDLIARLALADVVSLAGHQHDIPERLARSQLFLMSSAFEGLPIALIEAAVSGLPVVVTDVGGCREVVETCNNGIVVNSRSSREFALAISEIVSDPKRFSMYSANAMNQSCAFAIETAGEAHLGLYNRLLRRPS